MIYDYITTKPPLDENTMSEYGLTYLEHGRMKGWVAATHKYLDRVWKNGKWVYSYAKKTGSGALKNAKSTATNLSKSLSKSTNSGLNRLGSMMDRIRKKYGNGQAKAAAKKAYNTAKQIGEDIKAIGIPTTKSRAAIIGREATRKAKNIARNTKKETSEILKKARNTSNNIKAAAGSAKNTAIKEAKYLTTKTKNAAKKTYSEAKKTAKNIQTEYKNAQVKETRRKLRISPETVTASTKKTIRPFGTKYEARIKPNSTGAGSGKPRSYGNDSGSIGMTASKESVINGRKRTKKKKS
jgi:hypothetical protein